MRAALWLLALFGIAVSAALVAGNNQAVITLFWPPHRIDLSFNLAVLLLAGLFLLLYLASRALTALFSLPLEARRWRAQQKERAMFGSLLDSLAHQLAGRYIRATKSAQNALAQEKSLHLVADESRYEVGHSAARSNQLRSLAHLMVAESAQSLQNRPLREEHLQLALQSSAHRNAMEVREGVQFRAARWAMDDQDPGAALDWLGQLPQGAARRTLALRMNCAPRVSCGRPGRHWKPRACWPSTVLFRPLRRKASCVVWRLNSSTTPTTRPSCNAPGIRSTRAREPCLSWSFMRHPA